MSTVSELVDRCFREYLWPNDDWPISFTLGANLAQGGTSLTYDDGQLTVEDEQAFSPGARVDIWGSTAAETLLIGRNLDTSLNTVDVEKRGVAGTSDVAHSTGDLAYINPTWTRQAVYDAILDNVVDLWPELWIETTAALTLPARTSADRLAEAPADMQVPKRFIWTSGSSWRQADVRAYYDMPTAEFASGKAVDAPDVAASTSGYLVYTSQFARPTSPSYDLSANGVDESWDRIVTIGAAAQLLAGREFEDVTQEFLTEQFEQQQHPPGAAIDVAFRLWRLHRDLLQRASSELSNRGGNEPVIRKHKAVWEGV